MGDEHLDVLKDVRQWMRFLGMQQVEDVLADTLESTDKRAVYEAADGSRSTRDIADETEAHRGTVGNWLRAWTAKGIVVKNDDGRYEHLVSLDATDVPMEVKEDE